MHRVVARILSVLHREDILDILERVGRTLEGRVPHTPRASLCHGLCLHEQAQSLGLIGGITRLAEVARGLAKDLLVSEHSVLPAG